MSLDALLDQIREADADTLDAIEAAERSLRVSRPKVLMAIAVRRRELAQ